jgi:hypothetical protein
MKKILITILIHSILLVACLSNTEKSDSYKYQTNLNIDTTTVIDTSIIIDTTKPICPWKPEYEIGLFFDEDLIRVVYGNAIINPRQGIFLDKYWKHSQYFTHRVDYAILGDSIIKRAVDFNSINHDTLRRFYVNQNAIKDKIFMQKHAPLTQHYFRIFGWIDSYYKNSQPIKYTERNIKFSIPTINRILKPNKVISFHYKNNVLAYIDGVFYNKKRNNFIHLEFFLKDEYVYICKYLKPIEENKYGQKSLPPNISSSLNLAPIIETEGYLFRKNKLMVIKNIFNEYTCSLKKENKKKGEQLLKNHYVPLSRLFNNTQNNN